MIFGIVDLTYARPSAYFEAGYLEGLGKGVIYICRKDHFKPKETDKHGNERIHFDLITKNIISWTLPNQQFKNSLQRRVKLITKPIISSLRIGTEETELKKEFAMLSLTERLKLVKETAIAFLKLKKFREVPNGRFVYNTLRRNQDLAKVEVFDTVLKDDLFHFHFLDPENLPSHVKFYRIFCSLKATPKSRIEKALRLYNPIGNKIYRNGATIVIVIDSIDSIFKLKRQLNELPL